MSALNDLMVRLLGQNWKTTLTGWATALSSFAAVILVAFGEGKWAIVAGALSAVAKVLNGMVAADADDAVTLKVAPPKPRSITLDPPDLRSGNVRLDLLIILGVVGTLTAILLTGCGTVMPRVQDKADSLAARTPYGPAILGGFRQAEGERAGMVKLPADAVTVREFVDNAGVPLTNGVREVTTIRYERPLVPSAIAPVPAPPVQPTTNATSNADLLDTL